MTALTTIAAGTGSIPDINDNFIAAGPAGMYGRRAAGTAGLTWGYFGGRGFGNTIADGTVALTGSTTNYVVANRSTGVVSVSTAATNWNDTANYFRLYLIVTGSAAITSATDYREFASSGSAPGDVVGPASSVGGNVATFSGTSGKLIQDSGTALSALATTAYADAAVNALSWKQSVRAATTANGTLATAYANGQSIDGVTLATGNRILLKNQTTASENGIYTVAASGAPARTTDADSGAEMVGAAVIVSEGTTQADTFWICTTNAPITVGSTSLAFSQITGGGGGGGTWGSITGTLSSQTDLQTALDLKQSRSPSVQSVTSSATVTPTFSNDAVKITAQAAGLTLANPTGTAIDMFGMVIRIKDNGTARAITFGTQYRAIGVVLPTTTVIGKTIYIAMVWNNDDTKWDVLSVGQEQ